MSLGDKIGEYKNVIVSALAIVTAVAGTTVVVESRYARAQDVKQQFKDQQNRIDYQLNQLTVVGLENRRAALKSKQRELEVEARKRQLSAFENEWRQELEEEVGKLTNQIKNLGGQ